MPDALQTRAAASSGVPKTAGLSVEKQEASWSTSLASRVPSSTVFNSLGERKRGEVAFYSLG